MKKIKLKFSEKEENLDNEMFSKESFLSDFEMKEAMGGGEQTITYHSINTYDPYAGTLTVDRDAYNDSPSNPPIFT
ncbi:MULTISPECIES: hypothetical protein [Sphingobacterium]|uniref:hypothetical protein n=1 Tax=Sphingobacterium TaxID=28453 RepID=UPI0008A51377|nr:MULTISPECIES: hypothetical protein [Sphingobacterium]OFV10610.1 hypothetical protein HMPREF3127_21260 [Sphingobacterium sp. HMSC13C05]